MSEVFANRQAGVCPNCRLACPVHTDSRAYVELIALGRYEEAFDVICANNPFPGVCSLICHHPCEQDCRRGQVDAPLALRALKRFVVEQVGQYRRQKRRRLEITRNESVGVIGAGPTGLSAAYDCIRQGYAVTVYEAMSKPGGMLAYAVPRFRLPEKYIEEDIADILATGIELRLGVRVGEHLTLSELRRQHQALILAVGLCASRELVLENSDHPDVHAALSFLHQVARGEIQWVPERVIVIGGGNVAVNVARSAIRLGAASVKMVCLENPEEMPAWPWEAQEGLEEGIEVLHRCGPKQILIEQGKIVGIALRKVQQVFDAQGRFAPSYCHAELPALAGEMVVIAVGQCVDTLFMKDTQLRLTAAGLLDMAPQSWRTTVEGIFACGDVVTGPGTAIAAIAGGHKVAAEAMAYLQGEQLQGSASRWYKLDDLPQELLPKLEKIDRVAVALAPARQRKNDFRQVELGYLEEEALAESRRCLNCTAGARVDEQKCVACLNCLRICPFAAPEVKDVASMRLEICQACGLCASECPAQAIVINRHGFANLPEHIGALVKQSPLAPSRLELICYHLCDHRQDLQERLISSNDAITARIALPCVALVDEVAMMKAFELGIQTVVLCSCAECRSPQAYLYLQARLARVRSILDTIGIGGVNLVIESSNKDLYK